MTRATWLRRSLAAAVLIAAACLGLTSCESGAAVSSKAPFSDPSAVGYIGLCNRAGKQVRSGNIDSVPFAWRAVSSEAAPAPYDNAWRTAILLAYQPRQGLPAGEWSGDELTASARYTNPAHPMAAATDGDDSLEDFIEEFHPVWDGFLELRLYLGTKDAQTYSEQYPMLAIQVTGNTWHAVGGGPVNCHSGTAESIESIVLPKSATSPSTTTTTGPASATTAGSRAAVRSGSSHRPAVSATRAPGRSAAHGASGRPGLGGVTLATAHGADGRSALELIVPAGLAGIAGVTFLVARRRRLATVSSPSGTPRRTTTKGHRS